MGRPNLAHWLLATGHSVLIHDSSYLTPAPMNDRQRATDILKNARNILAERLTELVLEQRDELLDDARGDSYMNEIESLYEQIGVKLSHVGQMLSNLPADEPAAAQTHTAAAQHTAENTFTVATEPAPNFDSITHDTTPALIGPLFIATPALPAPKTSEPPKHRATNS